MEFLSSLPSVITVILETAGVCLLALEVWIGHQVEGIGEALSPWRRLQFLFAAKDYRRFWIERRLQMGRPPAEVSSMVAVLTSTALQQAVDDEWSQIAPNLARSLHRWERYTAPAARRLRKASLATGVLLILAATWLAFSRERSSAEPRNSGAALVLPALALAQHRLAPFPSGVENSFPELAEDVCRVRQVLRSSGSDVAVIVGRHDPRPLTPAGRRRLGSNLGLAQRRAETVARLLLDPSACPGSGPIDAIAIAAPNARSTQGEIVSSALSLADERRPDVIGLRLVLPSKN